MTRFVSKQIVKRNPMLRYTLKNNDNNVEKIIEEKKENIVMTTQEKIMAASDILTSAPVKKIKKDKGLIERTESSMTILTEDNKELLKD